MGSAAIPEPSATTADRSIGTAMTQGETLISHVAGARQDARWRVTVVIDGQDVELDLANLSAGHSVRPLLPANRVVVAPDLGAAMRAEHHAVQPCSRGYR